MNIPLEQKLRILLKSSREDLSDLKAQLGICSEMARTSPGNRKFLLHPDELQNLKSKREISVMCGVLGGLVSHTTEFSNETFLNGLKSLSHRGPDSSGIEEVI